MIAERDVTAEKRTGFRPDVTLGADPKNLYR
jgi:hypothetical protein